MTPGRVVTRAVGGRVPERGAAGSSLTDEQRAEVAAMIDEERERERLAARQFHLVVREALVMILRAYEGRFLPDLKKSARQPNGDNAIAGPTTQ